MNSKDLEYSTQVVWTTFIILYGAFASNLYLYNALCRLFQSSFTVINRKKWSMTQTEFNSAVNNKKEHAACW